MRSVSTSGYQKLLECPFCGGEAECNKWYSATISGKYATVCKECSCGTDYYNTEAEAEAAWNTRTFKAVYEDGNLCRIVTDTDTYIPERTCRNTNSPNARNFICSECLESYPKAELTECPNYCPNCRAKVVSE